MLPELPSIDSGNFTPNYQSPEKKEKKDQEVIPDPDARGSARKAQENLRQRIDAIKAQPGLSKREREEREEDSFMSGLADTGKNTSFAEALAKERKDRDQYDFNQKEFAFNDQDDYFTQEDIPKTTANVDYDAAGNYDPNRTGGGPSRAAQYLQEKMGVKTGTTKSFMSKMGTLGQEYGEYEGNKLGMELSTGPLRQ